MQGSEKPVSNSFVIEGEAPPADMDKLMGFALSIGLRAYCPLELPGTAAGKEHEPVHFVTRMDLLNFAERSPEFRTKKNLPHRIWNRLALNYGRSSLNFQGPLTRINGYGASAPLNLDFGSLERLVETIDAQAAVSGDMKAAIDTNFGIHTNIGPGTMDFLRAFVQNHRQNMWMHEEN